MGVYTFKKSDKGFRIEALRLPTLTNWYFDPRLTPKNSRIFRFLPVVHTKEEPSEADFSEGFRVAQIGLEPMTLRV